MSRQLLILKMAQVAIQRLFAAAWLAGFFALMGLPWSHSWVPAWSAGWMGKASTVWADFAVHGPERWTPQNLNDRVPPKAIQPQRPTQKHSETQPAIDGWWV